MCKFPVLLVCFVTFVVHAEGQSHPQDATFWKAQTQNEKITYIEGYVKGYFAGRFDMISAFVEGGAKPVTNIAKNANRDVPDKITFGTLVDGVDACYNDFRNSRLEVDSCIAWTVRGVKGESDSDREAFLAEMRRIATEVDQQHR